LKNEATPFAEGDELFHGLGICGGIHL
jgi:hypothetical protein